jgi:hypothetical protein
MIFDLVTAIALTASAAITVALVAAAFSSNTGVRLRILIGLVAWFGVVVALGAGRVLTNDAGLGSAGLGLAVALPVLILTAFAFGTKNGRVAVAAAPLASLVQLHSTRVAGVVFLLLYVARRLPETFAVSAGWGDIAVGLTAPFVARGLSRNAPGSRHIAIGWNLLGMLDLVVAVGLGVTSSPGPVRLFQGEPSAALMSELPMLLVPAFLVPLFFATHLITMARLASASTETRRPMPA